MAKDVKVLKLLRKARGIVAKGWTKDVLATDKKGNVVSVRSDKAVSFCAIGALRRAEYELGTKGVATKARRKLRDSLPANWSWLAPKSVMMYNDRHSKDKVLALFDRAINKVK